MNHPLEGGGKGGMMIPSLIHLRVSRLRMAENDREQLSIAPL